ncbi:PIG-L family deacetylase [Paenibacillus albicereus]|uniref:PIG-L family deacetylase n=1 Tax=Paenibacillus albicereus TaxID=2726185 RepID=A0A6H2GT90_9BACL|nr:PIG-L family deacetylase [Paenibacillus albicereus]QJC50612.1 PIG-L family deacetylase [Paenibacillus albicereus]
MEGIEMEGIKTPVALLLAHPDDESFLAAALCRRLAELGEPAVLLTATRGDAGGRGSELAASLGRRLGEIREQELEDAAAILGIREVGHLGYPDGKLGEADEEEAVERAALWLAMRRPATLVTFPPDGGNGHPDHRAISRIGTRLVQERRVAGLERLVYIGSETLAREGRKEALALDTAAVWPAKAAALAAHRSQIDTIATYFGDLSEAPEAWRFERFYLAWEDGKAWPGAEEPGSVSDTEEG